MARKRYIVEEIEEEKEEPGCGTVIVGVIILAMIISSTKSCSSDNSNSKGEFASAPAVQELDKRLITDSVQTEKATNLNSYQIEDNKENAIDKEKTTNLNDENSN